MATPTPLPSNASQTPLPSISPFPTHLPGEEAGFCGLTGGQWHLVLMLAILPSLLALFIVVIISWLNEKTIFAVLLESQKRAEMARTEMREKLLGHLLSDSDVRILTPGVTPRRYPLVDFLLLPLLTRVRRGPGLH